MEKRRTLWLIILVSICILLLGNIALMEETELVEVLDELSVPVQTESASVENAELLPIDGESILPDEAPVRVDELPEDTELDSENVILESAIETDIVVEEPSFAADDLVEHTPAFALDLSGVTKTNNTSGTGKVNLVSGTAPDSALYARVTWVYTLSNEDSFAYCAMKEVVFSDGTGTFNMVSPKAPYGATLDAVQVALVDDPDADGKGTYISLATAKLQSPGENLPVPTSAPTATPGPTPSAEPTARITAIPSPTPKANIPGLLKGAHGLQYARGDSGDAVKYIQQMLIDQLFLPSGQADGSYGPQTEAAVRSFQKATGLNPTGIADLSVQYGLAVFETGFAGVSGTDYEYAGLQRYGVYRFSKGLFIGLLKSDRNYQEGTFIYNDGTIYAGSFNNNLRNGRGEVWHPNGDYYIGNWKDDLMEGNGIYHFGSVNSVEKYDGEWSKGTMSGNGIYTLPDGTTIKAKWENNVPIGWWK